MINDMKSAIGKSFITVFVDCKIENYHNCEITFKLDVNPYIGI